MKNNNEEQQGVIALTQENYEEDVINSKGFIIIDFFADWCGPCRLMNPIFEKFSQEYSLKMKFLKVDVETQTELRKKFEVRQIPMFFILDMGRIVGHISGGCTEKEFREKVDCILNTVIPECSVKKRSRGF